MAWKASYRGFELEAEEADRNSKKAMALDPRKRADRSVRIVGIQGLGSDGPKDLAFDLTFKSIKAFKKSACLRDAGYSSGLYLSGAEGAWALSLNPTGNDSRLIGFVLGSSQGEAIAELKDETDWLNRKAFAVAILDSQGRVWYFNANVVLLGDISDRDIGLALEGEILAHCRLVPPAIVLGLFQMAQQGRLPEPVKYGHKPDSQVLFG